MFSSGDEWRRQHFPRRSDAEGGGVKQVDLDSGLIQEPGCEQCRRELAAPARHVQQPHPIADRMPAQVGAPVTGGGQIPVILGGQRLKRFHLCPPCLTPVL